MQHHQPEQRPYVLKRFIERRKTQNTGACCIATMGQAFTLTAFAVGGSCRGAGLYELERSSAAKEPKACMCIPFAFAKAVFDFVDDAFNS